MTSTSNLRARIAAGDGLVALRGDIRWSQDELSKLAHRRGRYTLATEVADHSALDASAS